MHQLEARTPMAYVILDEQSTGQCSGLSVDTTPFYYKYLIEIVWSLHEQVKQRFIIGLHFFLGALYFGNIRRPKIEFLPEYRAKNYNEREYAEK